MSVVSYSTACPLRVGYWELAKVANFSMTSPTMLSGVEAPAVTATVTGPVGGSQSLTVVSLSPPLGAGVSDGRCVSSVAERRHEGAAM